MNDDSFMKSLFHGVIAEDVIFPYPEPSDGEADSINTMLDSVRRFFAANVDSAQDRSRARDPGERAAGVEGASGSSGSQIPTEYGGIGLSATGYARVMQEIGGARPVHRRHARRAPVDRPQGHPPLRHRGAEAAVPPAPRHRRDRRRLRAHRAERRERRGRHPDARRARSRTARTCSTARRFWITNGGFADLFTVFARTSPAEEGAKPRITAFLVERGMGVESGPNEHKLGIRGSSTTAIYFDDVRGPGGERARRGRARLQGGDGGAQQRAPGPRQRRGRRLEAPPQAGRRARAGAQGVRPLDRRVRPHQGQDRHDDGRDVRARVRDVPHDRPRRRAGSQRLLDRERHLQSARLGDASGAWRTRRCRSPPASATCRSSRTSAGCATRASTSSSRGPTRSSAASSRSAGCRGRAARSSTCRARCASPSRGSGLLSDFAIRKARTVARSRAAVARAPAAQPRVGHLRGLRRRRSARNVEKVLRKHGREHRRDAVHAEAHGRHGDRSLCHRQRHRAHDARDRASGARRGRAARWT